MSKIALNSHFKQQILANIQNKIGITRTIGLSLSYIWSMKYQEFIEIRPDKRFVKPCLKGTRISVYDVLNWLSNGMSKQEILSDFNELSDEMINACLAFAADKEHKFRVASWNYSSTKIYPLKLSLLFKLTFRGHNKSFKLD